MNPKASRACEETAPSAECACLITAATQAEADLTRKLMLFKLSNNRVSVCGCWSAVRGNIYTHKLNGKGANALRLLKIINAHRLLPGELTWQNAFSLFTHYNSTWICFLSTALELHAKIILKYISHSYQLRFVRWLMKHEAEQ